MGETKDWSIEVEARGAGSFDVDDADKVIDALIDYSPAVSVDSETLSVRFALPAHSLPDAVTSGLALILRTCPQLDVTHVEAQALDELDEQLSVDDANYVGLAEVAQILHVSKQRASALTRKPSFPHPVGTLKSGPIWKLESIVRFLSTWSRRPGRPRKDRGPAGASRPDGARLVSDAGAREEAFAALKVAAEEFLVIASLVPLAAETPLFGLGARHVAQIPETTGTAEFATIPSVQEATSPNDRLGALLAKAVDQESDDSVTYRQLMAA